MTPHALDPQRLQAHCNTTSEQTHSRIGTVLPPLFLNLSLYEKTSLMKRHYINFVHQTLMQRPRYADSPVTAHYALNPMPYALRTLYVDNAAVLLIDSDS
jgi:hypothetical protein